MGPVQNSPEQLPSLGGYNGESIAVEGVSSNEAVQDGRNEQLERRMGQAIESGALNEGVAPSLTLPVPVSDSSDDTQVAQQPGDDLPLVAADEDLIEKEWVDKVKQVISSTRDDPYRREQEVKKIQLEYVKKRYGKSIGDVDSPQGSLAA